MSEHGRRTCSVRTRPAAGALAVVVVDRRLTDARTAVTAAKAAVQAARTALRQSAPGQYR